MDEKNKLPGTYIHLGSLFTINTQTHTHTQKHLVGKTKGLHPEELLQRNNTIIIETR